MQVAAKWRGEDGFRYCAIHDGERPTNHERNGNQSSMTREALVHSPRLALELSLLQLMADDIRTSTLRSVGMDEAEAIRIQAATKLRLPQQASSALGDYVLLLGPEAVVRRLDDSDIRVFAPSRAHCFSLVLWPHLYWVVNQSSDGRS